MKFIVEIRDPWDGHDEQDVAQDIREALEEDGNYSEFDVTPLFDELTINPITTPVALLNVEAIEKGEF
jgi:hypothetical protein